MNEINVRIFRNGNEIRQVKRPLRELNGKPAITYKGKLWPVVEGRVLLDGIQPEKPEVVSDSETVSQTPAAINKDIDVHIFRNGKKVKQVKRPLRELNGEPAVTINKQLWPVVEGRVLLDGIQPEKPEVVSDSETVSQAPATINKDIDVPIFQNGVAHDVDAPNSKKDEPAAIMKRIIERQKVF